MGNFDPPLLSIHWAIVLMFWHEDNPPFTPIMAAGNVCRHDALWQIFDSKYPESSYRIETHKNSHLGGFLPSTVRLVTIFTKLVQTMHIVEINIMYCRQNHSSIHVNHIFWAPKKSTFTRDIPNKCLWMVPIT